MRLPGEEDIGRTAWTQQKYDELPDKPMLQVPSWLRRDRNVAQVRVTPSMMEYRKATSMECFAHEQLEPNHSSSTPMKQLLRQLTLHHSRIWPSILRCRRQTSHWGILAQSPCLAASTEIRLKSNSMEFGSSPCEMGRPACGNCCRVPRRSCPASPRCLSSVAGSLSISSPPLQRSPGVRSPCCFFSSLQSFELELCLGA